MKYRLFSKMDWQISVLGFGAMRLPILNGKTDAIDEPLATRMLHLGIDHGINYLDTAYTYHEGQSEPFVGRALQGGFRQKVRLATKMPTWLTKTRSDFDKFLGEQLQRLQTDHVDLYLLHALSNLRWKSLQELDVCEWAEKAVASGRIGCLGFSFHDEFPVFKKILDDYDGWSFCQIQYNYMDINEQAGTNGLKYAASKGLSVVVMEPLLGGKLAVLPESIQEIFDSAPVKRSPADWALQWVWNQPEVTLALSGMSLMQHVEENLVSAEKSSTGSLTGDEQELITRVRLKLKEAYPIPCTKCLYCMPCPNGVDIPRNFDIFNKGAGMELWDSARFRYGQIPPGEIAEACIDCGECETKCPQSIHISDWMPQIHDVLGLGKPFNKQFHPGDQASPK